MAEHIHGGEGILVPCDCSLPDPELAQLVHDLNIDGNHRLANVIQDLIDRKEAAPPAPVAQPVQVPEPITRNDADGWWMYKGRRVGGGCAEWYNRALEDCRAAMLSNEPVSNIDELPNFRENENSSTKYFRENAETSTKLHEKCWCHTCRPVTMTDMRFVVCPECGNKRCPHANDHRHACSGSNKPGQEGSAYPERQEPTK